MPCANLSVKGCAISPARVPTDLWAELKARVSLCYRARPRPMARQLAIGIRADYAYLLPSALACFEEHFEACIAHPRQPFAHRRVMRTTNLLERLFVEERRSLKISPNGFGQKPVLKLTFGVLIRLAERRRGLRFTGSEHHGRRRNRERRGQASRSACAF